MSLEEELVELNTAYQNSRETVVALKKRLAALEKLARDQRTWMLDIAPYGYREGAKAAPLREQWSALMELPVALSELPDAPLPMEGTYDDIATTGQ